MRNRTEPGHVLLIIVMGACIATCQDGAGPEPEAVFGLQVVDETFRIGADDPVQIDSFAARLAPGAEGNLNGVPRSGDGGVNSPWSRHLDPGTVAVAALTPEACDGRPSMVEDDLDHRLEIVERRCPRGARVIGLGAMLI